MTYAGGMFQGGFHYKPDLHLEYGTPAQANVASLAAVNANADRLIGEITSHQKHVERQRRAAISKAAQALEAAAEAKATADEAFLEERAANDAAAAKQRQDDADKARAKHDESPEPMAGSEAAGSSEDASAMQTQQALNTGPANILPSGPPQTNDDVHRQIDVMFADNNRLKDAADGQSQIDQEIDRLKARRRCHCRERFAQGQFRPANGNRRCCLDQLA